MDIKYDEFILELYKRLMINKADERLSMIKAADEALAEIEGLLERMLELAEKSASDDNGVDRKALDVEFQQLKQRIDHIWKQEGYGKDTENP